MSAPGRITKHAIRLAPFGRHTRYMLVGYLRHTLMVTAILLAIALTIDLWPQFHIIAVDNGYGVPGAIWSVLRYAGLRTPGLIAPFFPFATFLGVLWTEVVLTQSGERMLVWNSGRSPVQCLAPVVLLGLILGAGEFVLDAYLGPASMSLQAQERLGLDGQRLDRTRTSDPSWIALPDGLLRTEVEYGPPSVLHNLTFFRRDADGQLTEVVMAAVAHREPGTSLWVLKDGRSWTAKNTPTPGGGPSIVLGSTSGEKMVPFDLRTLPLDLDPLWLSVFGMESQYLPLSVLRPLTRSDRDPESLRIYQTRLQVVYGEAVLPGAMALLAASLAMLLLAYTTPVPALIGIIFAGYLAHFGIKAFLLMGQIGYVSPVMAGWFIPAALLAATLLVLLVIARRTKSRAAPLNAA